MPTARTDPATPAKLLMVSNFFDTHRGGLEIVAGQLARALADRRFEVSWLAGDATPPPTCAERVRMVPVRAWNVTERRLGFPFPIPSPGSVARLVAEVRRADAVLLHDSLYPASIVAAVAARLSRKPLAIVQHIGAVPYGNPALKWIMAAANWCVARPMLAGADQVVFISEFVRDYFAKVRFRRPPELIFNGVDAEVFRVGDRAAARAKLGLEASAPVALFVGRFVEKKGLHLLRRMAEARPEITWAFAGWGALDPAAWGLANVRVFSGLSGAGLAELYQAADLLVLPSRGEGFPLVIQEALAAGLPVVCGAETAAADRMAAPLLDGVELDADPDVAADACARAVDRVLARPDPDGASASARRELVLKRYAWSAAAERYAAILNRLMQARAEPQASPATASAAQDGAA